MSEWCYSFLGEHGATSFGSVITGNLQGDGTIYSQPVNAHTTHAHFKLLFGAPTFITRAQMRFKNLQANDIGRRNEISDFDRDPRYLFQAYKSAGEHVAEVDINLTLSGMSFIAANEIGRYTTLQSVTVYGTGPDPFYANLMFQNTRHNNHSTPPSTR